MKHLGDFSRLFLKEILFFEGYEKLIADLVIRMINSQMQEKHIEALEEKEKRDKENKLQEE